MVVLGLLLSALGWGLGRAGVPQYGLFYGFLALFVAYTWLMARGWRTGRLLGHELRKASIEESA